LKWIKKIFGKKSESREEAGPININFEDLPAWLNERYQKISSGVEREVSEISKELESSLIELKESNSRLAEAKVEGDFDIRVVKRAKSNRENVIKQVSMLTEKIKFQENKDFRVLREFYETSSQSFENCLEHMNQSFRYTKGVFPEESKEVNEKLAELGKVFNRLRAAILENDKEITAIEAARLDLDKMRDSFSSIRAQESELQSKKKKTLTLQTEISELDRAVEEFKEGNAWKNLQSMQTELDTATEKLKEAETSLTSLVLPLSNYLSRIKKLHESGKYTLNPEIKNQLDLSLNKPVAVDPSFFPELQKIFEDNTLDMQAQKKEKALSQVKTATSSFRARKETYLKVLQDFQAKKAQVSNSDTGQLSEFEHKKAELLSRIHLLEEDIESSEKKLSVMRKELEDVKGKLILKINLIDSNIKVNFGF
jgi:chromosome segregation ATPase